MDFKKLSELTVMDLKKFKYPNLMAEVKETTYSICTIADHMGLPLPYRKSDDPETWSKLTGETPILLSEMVGLCRLFGVELEYLASHELKTFKGMSAAYWRWFDRKEREAKENEINSQACEIWRELKQKPWLLKPVQHMVALSDEQIDEFMKQLTEQQRPAT